MTDYEGVDMDNGSSSQRRRHRSPGRSCVVPSCSRPRASTHLEPRIAELALCWSHLHAAHEAEESHKRQQLLAIYTRTAEEQGRKPEDMFWAPDIFESQHAQELQNKDDTRRALEHYYSLVESGRIKRLSDRSSNSAASGVDGSVYYLRVGSFIKIGWSSNLQKRMKGYPPDSVLLAIEPGTRKDENRRHRMFAAHRTHGREWYAMTPSVMHHVEQVAAEFGTPDTVSFAARPVEIPQRRQVETIRPRGWSGKAS